MTLTFISWFGESSDMQESIACANGRKLNGEVFQRSNKSNDNENFCASVAKTPSKKKRADLCGQHKADPKLSTFSRKDED